MTHKTDLVELGVLAEEVDERALPEGVGERRVEGQRGHLLVEEADPLAHGPGRHEVALVDDEDEMLVLRVLAHVPLQVRAARARDVARVQHLRGKGG